MNILVWILRFLLFEWLGEPRLLAVCLGKTSRGCNEGIAVLTIAKLAIKSDHVFPQVSASALV